MRKFLVILAGAVLFLAIAIYVFINYAPPQWHWRLYAYQAEKQEANRLEPGPTFTGRWNNWDSQGEILSWYTYKNGQRDGPYTVLLGIDGATSEGQYLAGQLEGVQKILHPDNAKTEIPYVDGKRQGIETYWYPDGQVAIEAPWENGQQQGTVMSYHLNGQRQAAIPFYAGKKEGVETTWSESGQVLSEENYRDNRKNGQSVFYLPSGGMDMVLNYHEDQLDGLQTWYHPDGRKAKEFNLRNGVPEGDWREWDSEGNLLVEEEYENGSPKEKKPAAGGEGQAEELNTPPLPPGANPL
ncbi:MAG: toxin-antitoxin system YwqK family antitoxin [Planctomycetota bacterium]|nr:toxin-antitoxin system YwqK family antitoxin [Planctomycetota bacterium]